MRLLRSGELGPLERLAEVGELAPGESLAHLGKQLAPLFLDVVAVAQVVVDGTAVVGINQAQVRQLGALVEVGDAGTRRLYTQKGFQSRTLRTAKRAGRPLPPVAVPDRDLGRLRAACDTEPAQRTARASRGTER